MIFPGFVGPTYQSASLNADAQRSVNLIPELVESGNGLNKYVFYGAPGKHLFTTLPTTPVRGLWPGDNRLFAAAGSKLYEITSGGSYTDLGDIGAGTSLVQMFPNGNELFIVAGDLAYVHNGVSLNPCLFEDSTPVTARTGAFLDGYFIAAKPDSKQYYIRPLTTSVWNTLDFFTKEGYPDNIASIIADHEELWLVGNETAEAHRDEGDQDFTFQRDPGAFNHMGCAAYASLVRLEDGPAWLAGDGRGKIWAVRTQGFMPKRVSTHAIEAVWESYSTVNDAWGYSYYERGHWFWVLSFPTANATWCYDATDGFWHERAWWDGSALQRDRGQTHAYVFGKHLVGDHTNGKIYQQSMSIYDDFGGDRRYIRTAPHLQNEAQRIFTGRLQLGLETGNGTLSAGLRISKDGGHSYGTSKTRSAGTTGDYKKRVIWRRLGGTRDRVFEVSLTTQLKVAILNAYLGHVGPGEE